LIEQLKTTYYRLIDKTKLGKKRYLFQSFSLANRLTGLIGPRGTGKTTLLLQYIKEKVSNIHSAMYVSSDHIYFNKSTLLEFVQYLYDNEQRTIFFFDEVHKYKNWDQELKNIVDSYMNLFRDTQYLKWYMTNYGDYGNTISL